MTKTRREERREETIREIKNLAWQQLEQAGSDQLSLRKISRDMRMSSAAIFRYFDSRQTLITALMNDAFENLSIHISAECEKFSTQTQLEKIIIACQSYRTWALANPAQYALIYGSPIFDYAPEWQSLTNSAKGSLEIFLKLITQAWHNGEINPKASSIQLSPALISQMQALIAARGYSAPPEILYSVIKGWTVLHGTVSLEVFKHITPILPDPSEFFNQSILDLLEQIGFQTQTKAPTV